MAFQYRPLPQGSKTIRILELQSGRKADKIRCNLQQCSFPPVDEIAYEPLSYCWGGMRDKLPIVLDDCCMNVTKNLHAALLQLRLKNESRRLWVDALCINQADNVEKIGQVQIMRDIYRHGSRTLVWLGPGSRNFIRGFSLIPKILKVSKRHPEKNRLDQEVRIPRRSLSPTISDFLSIFELPYFTRVWVIQEVAVSSSIEVICGDVSISWDSLADAVDSSPAIGIDELQEMRSLKPFYSISDARFSLQAKIKHDLLQLLVRHRDSAATCEKDKVYALLGLLDPEESQSHPIILNYLDTYATEEAYIDTAESILRTSGNLDLLSVPHSCSTSLDLPTWVPDWSCPAGSFSFIPFLTLPSFAATGSSTSHPIFRDQQKVVGLLGYVFDEVDCTGFTCADRPIPFSPKDRNHFLHVFSSSIQYWRIAAENLRAWKNWLRITCARSREVYVTGEPMLDAHWKTFMGGFLVPNDAKLAEYREVCEEIVGSLVGPSGLFDHPSAWYTYCVAVGVFGTLKDTIQRIPESDKVDGDLFSCSYGRCMFTTKDKYIGLGSRNIQSGDCLALLEGGQVPYVLRRKGQTYELVGECYIHGVMQGERFDKSKCEQMWLV